jgi:hypothetical protein
MPRKKSVPPLVIVPTTADHGPAGSARSRNGVIVPNLVRGMLRNGQRTLEFHGFRIISPLQLYHRRRTINEREALAGKRYADTWHVYQASLPRTTGRYNDMPTHQGSGGGIAGSTGPLWQLEELHAELGAVATRILMAVCLDGIGVVAYAKAAKWRKPDDAMAVLRCGLQTTADYFKLPEG